MDKLQELLLQENIKLQSPYYKGMILYADYAPSFSNIDT